MSEVDRQLEIIREGSVDFFGEDELRDRLVSALREKRPLRVKLGMDPSAPDLHLGHTVVLRKLRAFQELGHTPIFLIGDFTARIGDPSGKNKTRPPVDEDTVRENAGTYVEQVAQILDVERAEVRFNSEWMSQLSPADFVRLCSRYTVARLLERDDFAKRYAAQEPIAVHELLYPFVQAYDSVALRADVELGGTDQTFNLLMAREIQRDYDQPPQAVITHPLLVGADGRKMSKSLGNHIGILEAPEEVYGKLMSVPDTLLAEYASLLAAPADLRDRCAAAGGGSGEPMAAKQALAAHVVEALRGAEEAKRAADHFRRVVQRKQVPDDVETTSVELTGAAGLPLLEVLERLALVKSRSEARRLVAQGGVQVDGARADDATRQLGPGSYLIQVGKRRFARVELAE